VARKTPDIPGEDEFTGFMRAYQDMVYSTAARLTGNDAQAQEIAQETFLKAYENFHHLRTSPTAGGWLRTVARRQSLNHLTRYRSRWRLFSDMRAADADDSDDLEFEIPVDDAAASEIDSAERHERIEQALQKLPDHQRVPLVLFHFEDMSYEDIASQLNITLAKLKTDMLRGRAALAKVLQRRGVTRESIEV
jgi:RNA polymerase sigma-70 factor (ECF subfamily)